MVTALFRTEAVKQSISPGIPGSEAHWERSHQIGIESAWYDRQPHPNRRNRYDRWRQILLSNFELPIIQTESYGRLFWSSEHPILQQMLLGKRQFQPMDRM